MPVDFATDKTIRAKLTGNIGTADAVLNGILSADEQELVQFPATTDYPGSHTMFRFVGTMVPNNANLPDTVAPIGSRYLRLTLTAGAVTGATQYIKSAAATWTIATEQDLADYLLAADVGTAVAAAGFLATADLADEIEAADFSGLPTVDPAVAGKLWVSSGTVKVSAGV